MQVSQRDCQGQGCCPLPFPCCIHPGVALRQDQPLPSIEEELIPQGWAKDAAAHNANLQPFDVSGVAAAMPIVHANADKLNDYKINGNDGIIAMADIPQQPLHAPIVVNNTDDNNIVGSDDNNNNDTESNNEDGSDDNNKAESGNDELANLAAATDLDGDESDSNQGVQILQCRGKGIAKKYAAYSLMMAVR